MLARLRNRFIRNPMTSAPRERNSTSLSGPNAMRHSEYERHKEAGTMPAGTTPPVAPALEPAEARQSTGVGCLVAMGDVFGRRFPERWDFGSPGSVAAASPIAIGMPSPSPSPSPNTDLKVALIDAEGGIDPYP